MSNFADDVYAGGAGGAGVAEDLYNTGGSSEAAGGGGLKRVVPQAKKPLGFKKPLFDPRLIKTHDPVAARSKPPVKFDASRDDRMTKDEAGNTMVKIVQLLGLTGEKPEVLEAFYRAVLYSHAVNGSSVLQPGRATITVADTTFDYRAVVEYLGDSQRRFFRAFADEVLENNKRILDASDPYDIVAQEQASSLRQVAIARGLQRYPYLCHDSADACTNLNDTERTALASSKAMVFASTVNMADRNRFRPGQTGSPEVGLNYMMPTAQATALGVPK